MSDESKVRAFYSGKNLFITGGTGFVGLCLIEKILRCIPDVGKIYLLMRPKKGKEIADRLKEFHTNPVFEKLLEKETVEIFNKLVPVAGDVGSEDLAISPEDRQTIIDNVNVVIHSAATLDFEENLRPTVQINILGTRRITELCKQIKDLKVLVHVSSAYVNSYLTECTEKLYDAPADVEKIIELAKTMSDQALEDIEKEVLQDHPNTYTFTKHLAEHEVNKCSVKFPCAIVRPSMIVASWKEPVPGWTCSKVGPQGFLMGASKGVVRRLPMCVTNIADYIPVDVVVNQLLVAGWKGAAAKSGLSIYHCTSSTHNPFRWGMFNDIINNFMHQNPLKSAVWYPHLSFVSTLFMFRVSAIFVHFIPAILLDTVLRITGGRPILFRLHKNVWKSLSRLERFIFTEWHFHNTHTLELAQELNQADQSMFFIDIAELNWEEYFKSLYMGVRKYLNRESEKTLPAARSKDKILYFAHIVWQILALWLLWLGLATLTGQTLVKSPWAPALLCFLYSFL